MSKENSLFLVINKLGHGRRYDFANFRALVLHVIVKVEKFANYKRRIIADRNIQK